MRQSVLHYEAAARTGDAPDLHLRQVLVVDELHDAGTLYVVDMAASEQIESADLQNRSVVERHPIRAPLGPGEAACVAIASNREWIIVTDDTAALKVMRNLHGETGFEYERIRKLLMRAGRQRLITRERANEVHQAVRGLGFWDDGTPFPES